MSEQANRYPLPPAPAALSAQLPCMRGAGCPLGVNAEELAEAAARADAGRAYRAVRAVNPFASSCGHGCHAPCESACRRRALGAPVAIAALEAWASAQASPALAAPAGPCTSVHDARSVAGAVSRTVGAALTVPRSPHRVAIVGAGAAGLACAHDLALLGHRSVIFDEGQEPGGALTRLLPAFRFPVAAARGECASILGMHVELRAGTRVHGPGALDALLSDGFAAVFVAVGAWALRPSLLPETLGRPRVHDAVRLLAERVVLTGRAVVVGDTDLAVDAARHLVRGEGATVHLVTTSAEGALPLAMLAAAAAEGVHIHQGWMAARALPGADGGPTAVMLDRGTGRRLLALDCDHLVLAAPLVPALPDFAGDLPATADGFVATDAATLETGHARVWAGGACAFGHRSIAHATADGKRAAWHIHARLTRARAGARLASAWTECEGGVRERAREARAPRQVVLPLSPPPADPFSTAALPPAKALAREGARCLRCGSRPVASEGCTGCGACTTVCPSGALSLRAGGEGPRVAIDQDRCTRCGLCIPACPESALAMVRAVWDERLAMLPGAVPQAPGAGTALGAAPADPEPADTAAVDCHALAIPG